MAAWNEGNWNIGTWNYGGTSTLITGNSLTSSLTSVIPNHFCISFFICSPKLCIKGSFQCNCIHLNRSVCDTAPYRFSQSSAAATP